MNPWCSYNNTL